PSCDLYPLALHDALPISAWSSGWRCTRSCTGRRPRSSPSSSPRACATPAVRSPTRSRACSAGRSPRWRSPRCWARGRRGCRWRSTCSWPAWSHSRGWSRAATRTRTRTRSCWSRLEEQLLRDPQVVGDRLVRGRRVARLERRDDAAVLRVDGPLPVGGAVQRGDPDAHLPRAQARVGAGDQRVARRVDEGLVEAAVPLDELPCVALAGEQAFLLG